MQGLSLARFRLYGKWGRRRIKDFHYAWQLNLHLTRTHLCDWQWRSEVGGAETPEDEDLNKKQTSHLGIRWITQLYNNWPIVRSGNKLKYWMQLLL